MTVENQSFKSTFVPFKPHLIAHIKSQLPLFQLITGQFFQIHSVHSSKLCAELKSTSRHFLPINGIEFLILGHCEVILPVTCNS